MHAKASSRRSQAVRRVMLLLHSPLLHTLLSSAGTTHFQHMSAAVDCTLRSQNPKLVLPIYPHTYQPSSRFYKFSLPAKMTVVSFVLGHLSSGLPNMDGRHGQRYREREKAASRRNDRGPSVSVLALSKTVPPLSPRSRRVCIRELVTGRRRSARLAFWALPPPPLTGLREMPGTRPAFLQGVLDVAEDWPGNYRTPRRLRLARRRRDRATRETRLPHENRLFVLWRARREPIRLEGKRRDAREREGWPQGRGAARRRPLGRRDRFLRLRGLSSQIERAAF